MIQIEPEVSREFATCRNVEDFRRIECRIARRFKNRFTGRFERDGNGFYLKYHGPTGWWAILEELLRFRRPSIGAETEYRAIRALEALGVPTMRIAAFGQEGRNPARRRSFLVTHEIAPATDLERLAIAWAAHPPDPMFRRRLVGEVARMTRQMHRGGLNHRDLYICHFLLPTPQGADSTARSPAPLLHLIDLHRAQLRRRTPRRWIVKDLAGLYFSSMDAGLTRRDRLWFIRQYGGLELRQALSRRQSLWQQVSARAARLYRDHWHRPPPPSVPVA